MYIMWRLFWEVSVSFITSCDCNFQIRRVSVAIFVSKGDIGAII